MFWRRCVFHEVHIEFLNIIQISFKFQGVEELKDYSCGILDLRGIKI